MCKVSIVIPMYNVENQIENTLSSVINQTYKNIEVIIVDDGSTDNSVNICKSIDDDRIKIFTKINGGASSARNYGIEKATGDYLTFLDSDDQYKPKYIESLLKHKDYDLVICGIEKITDKGNVFIKNSFAYNSKEEIIQNIISILNTNMLNSPVNKLYKKEIIDNNNIKFNTSLEIGEDYNFNFEYIQDCENIKCIDEILYKYIIRNNSLSHKKINNYIEKRKVNIILTEKFFNKYGINKSYIDYLKLKLIYSAIMNDDNLTKKDIYNEYFRNLHVSGIINKLLYLIYKLNSMKLLKVVGVLFNIIRNRTNYRPKGTSM